MYALIAGLLASIYALINTFASLQIRNLFGLSLAYAMLMNAISVTGGRNVELTISTVFSLSFVCCVYFGIFKSKISKKKFTCQHNGNGIETESNDSIGGWHLSYCSCNSFFIKSKLQTFKNFCVFSLSLT